MAVTTIPTTKIACGCGAEALRTTWRRLGWVRFDVSYLKRGQMCRNVKWVCAQCGGRLAPKEGNREN